MFAIFKTFGAMAAVGFPQLGHCQETWYDVNQMEPHEYMSIKYSTELFICTGKRLKTNFLIGGQ